MAVGNEATCTVDGSAGAGVTFQAKVFNDIVLFSFDVVNSLFIMTDVNNKVTKLAITPATITITVSGGNYTVTVAD